MDAKRLGFLDIQERWRLTVFLSTGFLTKQEKQLSHGAH